MVFTGLKVAGICRLCPFLYCAELSSYTSGLENFEMIHMSLSNRVLFSKWVLWGSLLLKFQ